MNQFAFEPIYGSLPLAITLLGITIAVVLWVTPPTTNPSRRRALILLRLAAAAVLILSFLRPSIIRTDNRPADASVVVALDVSKSMTLTDGEGGVRFDTQMRAAKELIDGLKRLGAADEGTGESLSVKVLAYGEKTQGVSADDVLAASSQSLVGETEGVLRPTGGATDLVAALTDSINVTQGLPIAGVVLVGDGTQTVLVQGGGAASVARTLDSLGVPLWAIPIGPAANGGDSRDVAIDALSDSFQMFSGNRVDIHFQVQTRGLAGVDVPVRLLWVDENNQVSETATRRVRSDQARGVESVVVPITAPQPGTYQLVVEAETMTGETVTTNNRQIAFVEVREGGGRVMYIEGSLRQEYRFLRRTLRGFPDLELTTRWIPEDTQDAWPVDLAGIFEPGRFDVYILGDLDASALGPNQLGQLANAIDAGAGLITMGGFQTYGNGGYGTTELADVLPVKLGARRRQQENAWRGPLTLELAQPHPITDLGGTASENDASVDVWRDLPAQLGASRWSQIKRRPGTQTLLQTQDQEPLMVIGSYGRGRVASIAFDSTWRWWRAGRKDVHRRFWRQAVLWLLSREESGEDKIFLEMDQRRFASGQPPKFRASLQSPASSNVELVAEIVPRDGETDKDSQARSVSVTKLADPGKENRAAIRGTIPELPPGIYRLRVKPAGQGSKVTPKELAFQVIDQSLELTRPVADPVFMRQLADQTSDQGGRSFTVDEIDLLVQAVQDRRKKAETPVVEKARLGDGPRTGWPLFLLFAGALSTEWYLRRRWNLA